MHQFFQTKPIQISGLPFGIVCCSDASIGFVALANIGTIVQEEKAQDGFSYSAKYFHDKFVVNGGEFEFGIRYRYKEMPTLLAWLKAQDMLMPV